MAALVLEVEVREQLGPAVFEQLFLPAACLTVAELISERVRSRAANLSPAEREKAVTRALEVFRQGAFLLIVDDRRRTDLDETLFMTAGTRVRFWRLTPLQGG